MITAFLKRLARLAWLLPGFLLWAAFPPMAERFDCLFALAPLLWLARRGTVRLSARRWFVSGLIFWGATLSWMPAIIKNGGPWPLVVLGWAGLAAYCALYFAAFGALNAFYWGWTKRADAYWKRLIGLLLVEPILWCGLELVRSRFGGGFAWNHLGVVPANSGFGAPAALGGVYILSAVVILINGTIASIAERILAPVFDRFAAKTAPNWVRSVETFLPFLLIWGIYAIPPTSSNFQTSKPQNLPPAPSVALVQRNSPCCFRENEENPLQAYGRLYENVAFLKPDLVVLAESALAEFGSVSSRSASYFAKFTENSTGGALLAGGTRREGQRIYNSAALYSAQDPSAPGAYADPQVYDKVHLVPFGEFIPGDKLFPALQKLAPVGSCTPGEPKLLVFEKGCGTDVPLGVAICFEDTDSALVRAHARAGAQALVFITNDSWFSDSDEAVQHAWQAVPRAIETGLYVIRVGNSGVTGVIRPDGSADWLSGSDGRPLVDARGTMFDRIPLVPARPTLYTRVGDSPLAISFALLILGLIVIKYKTIYEQRRTVSL